MVKRILSGVLSLCLMLTWFPVAAMAAEDTAAAPLEQMEPGETLPGDREPEEDAGDEADISQQLPSQLEEAAAPAARPADAFAETQELTPQAEMEEVAYPVTGGNIYFDPATGTITDCDAEVTAAHIPSEINGVAVKGIGERAFEFCDSLTSVTLPDSLTSIGESTFHRCTSLENITLPDSLTSIGDGAFYYCYSLKSITLPDGLTSIGNRTFDNCSSLESITLPDKLASIGESAFYSCHDLTTIAFPDSLTLIGQSAFQHCIGLTSITLPDGLTSIGEFQFYGCGSRRDAGPYPARVSLLGNPLNF